MATFDARLQDLIGANYATIAAQSKSDLFNSAVAEVADMIPGELMLKYAQVPQELNTSTSEWNVVEGKKILQVLRLDAAEGSGGKYRLVRQVANAYFEKASDTDSIHLATKYSPVFKYWNTDGATRLVLFPAPNNDEKAEVWFFEYPTTDITSTSIIAGFPHEAEHLLVLKAAGNILQAFISDMVQDDEDSELMQMITAQQQGLEGQAMTELTRFSGQTKPKAE